MALAKQPSYARIGRTLRDRIGAGALPPGAVLLEGAIASLFGASRSTVRQALAELERDGLVSRFSGRGLLVAGGCEPLRLDLTPDHLGLEDDPPETAPRTDGLYYEVEREILTRSMFGRFRVNELALARHYGASRALARDLLLKAQGAGIVAKGERGHWWIVPLDETRIRDLYELRELLEPVALRAAAPHLPEGLVEGMRDRLRESLDPFGDLDIDTLDALEQDLHTTCLGFCPNGEIVGSLHRARASLIPGKHMQKILLAPDARDSFMAEHLDILDALLAAETERASVRLAEHLAISREKAVHRLHEFLARFQPTAIAYILE
ncbi:GntR family transcriptional regulator [Aureimonas sp. ME7]|uniref:GntR family transcriptional regulator n=1 Tax=Aureimonas sp. ME7 TaxID=2744252 RepID=UPI001AEDD168|nr:GntR family transcriptional regulator [Aureimonas sp. ME7]